MKRSLAFTILILFILLFTGTNSLFAVNYTFRGVNLANGLSDLLVNAIYKDSEGFVWLGTDNCLDRFDGTEIKHYPFNDSGNRRKRVNVITETEKGYLWIGNDLGLWQLELGNEFPEQQAVGTIDCPVYALLYKEDRKLYIGTEKGLFIKEGNEYHQILINPVSYYACNKIKGLTFDDNGILWVATMDGLYSYNPEKRDIISFAAKQGLAGENVFRNLTRIDQTLYLGTENAGILAFDIPTASFSRFVDVGSNIISSISTDGEDLLYVSTDGNGIHFVSHSEKRVVRSFVYDAKDRTGLRSNSVYSLLVDKEGLIWVGFYQAGFDYSLYQTGLFHVYGSSPWFDSMNLTVRSFLIHGKEKLIGTRDGLYYINERTGLVKTFVMPALRSNMIFSIRYYRGKFYIGTYGGGVSVIDAKTLQVSPFTGSNELTFRNGHIFCIKQDVKDNLWFGTSNGVFCYNGYTGDIKHYNATNSQIPEGNTYDIFFDSSGKGWICTENGLCIYDPVSESIRSNIFPEGFIHNEIVRHVYEDSKQTLYFLADKGGLFTSDLLMTRYSALPIHPILHGNAYMSIQEDDMGWLWLGADDGMVRLNPDTNDFYSFNFPDGIPSQVFLYPSYKDEEGILWFSNSKGLLYVDPHQVDSIKKNPYRLVITDILVEGISLDTGELKEAKDNGLLKLRKKQNNIGFRFVNLSYSDPASNTYSYLLDGYDKEWKLLDSNNEVSYYNLSPGKYTFRVQIAGNEQSRISQEVIIGSWLNSYREWIGVILVVGGLILIIVLLMIKRKNSANKETETPQAKRPAEESVSKETNQEKYKMNRLSEEECIVINKRLKKYMETDKPYINPELKIADLAQAIETSSHSLSYLFNQYLNQSYYDYINQYRIEEFKRLAKDPHYARYTLTAMATHCGFSSRASFFRSFKKVTGITPNEYIQSIGE
ncbi:MAG: helix-turn-helix domain-containing protein [Tannerellaceae bacterium]|nr:helix-turn-helix domain-containing protein [Tannerellaceae bacterium]